MNVKDNNIFENNKNDFLRWVEYINEQLNISQLKYVSTLYEKISENVIKYNEEIIDKLVELLKEKSIKWMSQRLPASLVWIKENDNYKSQPVLVRTKTTNTVEDFVNYYIETNEKVLILHAIYLKDGKITFRYDTWYDDNIIMLRDFIK